MEDTFYNGRMKDECGLRIGETCNGLEMNDRDMGLGALFLSLYCTNIFYIRTIINITRYHITQQVTFFDNIFLFYENIPSPQNYKYYSTVPQPVATN